MQTIGAWDTLLVIVKAIAYAATLGAAGGVFFLAYSHSLLEPALGRRLRRLLWALMIVSALAAIAKILVTAGSMSGDLAGMFDLELDTMIVQSGEGWALLIRLVGLLLIAWATATAGERRPSPGALVGSMAVATSFAWVGHVHALAAPTLPTLLLAVHLLAVAFWVGALLPLRLVTWDLDLPRVAATAARFALCASFVVAALLAAGSCLLAVLLYGVTAPWTIPYGRWAAAKIACVAGLLALAAFNRWRLTPRLLAQDSGAARTLRRSIEFEMTLVAGILLLTAAMTTLTGPRGSAREYYNPTTATTRYAHAGTSSDRRAFDRGRPLYPARIAQLFER